MMSVRDSKMNMIITGRRHVCSVRYASVDAGCRGTCAGMIDRLIESSYVNYEFVPAA